MFWRAGLMSIGFRVLVEIYCYVLMSTCRTRCSRRADHKTKSNQNKIKHNKTFYENTLNIFVFFEQSSTKKHKPKENLRWKDEHIEKVSLLFSKVQLLERKRRKKNVPESGETAKTCSWKFPEKPKEDNFIQCNVFFWFSSIHIKFIDSRKTFPKVS